MSNDEKFVMSDEENFDMSNDEVYQSLKNALEWSERQKRIRWTIISAIGWALTVAAVVLTAMGAILSGILSIVALYVLILAFTTNDFFKLPSMICICVNIFILWMFVVNVIAGILL